ncbi:MULTISPECIES: hypothetical protein [Leptolyngbya]|jgi:hypothetical protein|uniref:Dihydropteroate synthase n=2 Tax=Leptolyngbya boryana TaxID=1184 RepID=A0A1Z4JCH6_LEPBY|nr:MULTISPECIES: hypothetical protein [Leptolyngbya]BAY54494.1 dihydropteroate synthase [Leptolyngbya boryana NIES-2135]MCY6490699.1 hypothetical protein [Leptolyngbya sp. GGD]ULP31419.1 hypothetical protein MCP04_06600 [Leptolyngbya boryana IU 594]WNZ43525.1 hypothetical protein Q2T42_16905 [Leptolyngbya boryana CZ1]BAS59166.1 hypothetical protein LBWT_51350 [Leptolyngbya boryana IAM M-101]
MVFKVVTRNVDRDFDRWIDALDFAKSLMPDCKWFQDVRIFEKGNLVWVYSRSHKFPQFVGAGVYDRLAKRFLIETLESENALEAAEDEDAST